jgi:hypothetical protein
MSTREARAKLAPQREGVIATLPRFSLPVEVAAASIEQIDNSRK